MKPLHLNAKDESLHIHLDHEGNFLSICGESRPENCIQFYAGVWIWMHEFRVLLNYRKGTLKQAQQVRVEINLSYFNSASARCLLTIFRLIGKMAGDGHQVEVTWVYEKEDEDMQEAGLQLAEVAGIARLFRTTCAESCITIASQR